MTTNKIYIVKTGDSISRRLFIVTPNVCVSVFKRKKSFIEIWYGAIYPEEGYKLVEIFKDRGSRDYGVYYNNLKRLRLNVGCSEYGRFLIGEFSKLMSKIDKNLYSISGEIYQEVFASDHDLEEYDCAF